MMKYGDSGGSKKEMSNLVEQFPQEPFENVSLVHAQISLYTNRHMILKKHSRILK
jgi:hypothetical protein